MNEDFVYVDEHVPGIRWDAKYATWDNFTGRPVSGYLANRIVGTRELCAALCEAQSRAERHGFGLLLWDGYRPQRAVDCFAHWSRQPEDGRTKARHYPSISRADMFELGYVARRSGHSRGSTVDLTLFHQDTGELAETGGGHDLMDVVSHHGAPDVSPEARHNRGLLRFVMKEAGFAPYPEEWWHYTLIDEPFLDTYFDFPITSPVPGSGVPTPPWADQGAGIAA